MLSVSIDTTYSRVPHLRNVTGQPIPLRVAEGDTTWEREAERERRTLFDPTKAATDAVDVAREAIAANALYGLVPP